MKNLISNMRENKFYPPRETYRLTPNTLRPLFFAIKNLEHLLFLFNLAMMRIFDLFFFKYRRFLAIIMLIRKDFQEY